MVYHMCVRIAIVVDIINVVISWYQIVEKEPVILVWQTKKNSGWYFDVLIGQSLMIKCVKPILASVAIAIHNSAFGQGRIRDRVKTRQQTATAGFSAAKAARLE